MGDWLEGWDTGWASPEEVIWTLGALLAALYIGRLMLRRWKLWYAATHAEEWEEDVVLASWRNLVIKTYLFAMLFGHFLVGVAAMATPPRLQPAPTLTTLSTGVFLLLELGAVGLAFYLNVTDHRLTEIIRKAVEAGKAAMLRDPPRDERDVQRDIRDAARDERDRARDARDEQGS